MTQGVKHSNQDISDALIESDGIISIAAKKLGMCRQNLSTRISNEPELQPLLKDLRTNYNERRLDKSENVLDQYLNNWKKYPRLAFQSACYLLETHGKDRGYGKNKNEQEGNDKLLVSLIDGIKQQASNDIESETDPSIQSSI